MSWAECEVAQTVETCFAMKNNENEPACLEKLNKREHAAILLRVPKSGDDEIDAMIREANRRDAAVAAMQGLLSDRRAAIEFGEALMLVNDATPGSAAHTNALRKLIGIAAAGHAGAILAELEKKT